MKFSKLKSVAVATLACAAFGIGSVHAQQAITIVVPQPAGNPTDGAARKLQPLLQKELGQTVVVENVPGAGGSIGVNKVLNAPVEANTILIASQTEPILTPFTLKSVKYKPEDLRPIGLVSRLPYILVSKAGLPVQNLNELTAYAKKSGSAGLNFGHIGPGSMIHLLGEQWARKNNVSINHIGYKGVPPVVQDLMGGQIDVSFLPLGGSTLQMIESGKIKALGTSGATPSTYLPKVPAISASNKALSDFVYGTWITLFVSAKTSDEQVARLHKALSASINDAGFKTYITESGMAWAGANSIADLNKFYQTETKLYQGLAKEIGVEME